MDTPKTICMLPWTSMEVTPMGTYRPCCLYSESIPGHSVQNGNTIADAQNSDYMKQLRQQFLNGNKPAGCKMCWQEESVIGRMSKRKATFIKMKDTKIDYTEQDVAPIFLDLKLGNICNLKCRICGSWSSSKWAQEELDLANGDNNLARKQLKDGQWPRTNRNWWNALEDALEHIEFLEFTGGEPFLIDEHFDLLQILIDKGYSKKIDIHYNTNATVWPKRGAELWNQFKKVEIAFSIDDTGKRFEYQRFGSNWETTQQVIKTAQDVCRTRTNLSLQFCITFNVQNVYYWPETEQWINQQDIASRHYNILQEPPVFNLRNLSTNAKQKIADKIRQSKDKLKIEQIINFMNLSGIDMTQEFIKRIKIHDDYRKEKFEDSHLEIWKILHEE